eukprot:6815896-Prymnesium_polylepis.1
MDIVKRSDHRIEPFVSRAPRTVLRGMRHHVVSGGYMVGRHIRSRAGGHMDMDIVKRSDHRIEPF